MKPLYWIFLSLIVLGSSWLILRTGENEPRVEQKIDLNWKYIMDDDSAFSAVVYNDLNWNIVSLPHDWMIEGNIQKENPSGTAGGFYAGGIAWYRKNLDLSEYDSKKQFYLVFDGVYMNSDVWINGKHLGKHNYGYIGFNYDISDFIRKDTVNVIAVRTDCSKVPADRWYSGAGIYRHVKLIATDKLHFPVLHSRISHEVRGDERIARSEIEIVNKDKRSKRFKLKSDLIDPNGKLVCSSISSRSVDGHGTIKVQQEYMVDQPQLWTDKDPALYSLRSYILQNNKILDNIETSFGIRDAHFSPDSGFILNNKKVWLKGVCIHHDGGELGSAVPDATWEYRLKALKELGVNALRLAHNPHSPEVLDMCDKMGFFVIDEMYDKWEEKWDGANGEFNFSETYSEDLEYFIKRDINHPSVIIWSMGNETVEQLSDPESGVKWFETLAEITHSLDTSRMVSCGLHPAYPRDGMEIPSSYIHVEPLISYNYRTDSFAAWHEKYPEKIWLASETKAYNKNRRSEFEDISYMNNSWMDMEPFIAGQFIWAGIDYLGESAGWPYRSFNNGLLKTNAEIKPSAYYTQSIYSDNPMVKIVVVDNELVDSLNKSKNWQLPWAGAPVVRHWNFPGNEMLKILVYTNCTGVELFLNDSAVDSRLKSDFDDGVIKTDLAYSAGKISAKAWYLDSSNVKIYIADSILTAKQPSMIMLHPDKSELMADGEDVVHIETSVTDSAGITYPTASHMINYELEGPGNLKVIDNGDPADHSPFSSSKKRVYKGTHLVVIQSTVEPGDLIISATAEGLKPAQLKVKSVSKKKK